jgi:hypothetical protein
LKKKNGDFMTTYIQDFYGWTQEQANLLRTGRLSDLDIENLIEEIETMGRSEKRALESRLNVLLMHLLKWKYQPARRCKSWELTIKGQRLKLVGLLKDNPSLKSRLTEITAVAYASAVIDAAQETGIEESQFIMDCPWSFEQIMNNNFYPD